MVCQNCFTQVSESNIVADVTFQEDSRGAATVQGGFVGENARHARTLGSAAFRRVGASEKNSLQEIEASGRRALGSLCPKLGIPETTATQALALYSLAAQHNFAAGRRTDEVIAACLYAACRRQKDNAILLIDIAELQHLNVFRLGEVYKSMISELYLDESVVGGVGTQYLVEVESLVMKYCKRLEFGEATRQVAEDAVRIIRRMKRDWMVTGRHPAGLCGAAIILAARMNNFRRSTREVVYVAKVADMTVAKRVEEFRRTKSAALTVQEFRQYGVLLKDTHDPPVLYESELKKQKFEEKKRKRREAGEARDSVDISDAGSDAGSRETSANPDADQVAQDSPPHKRRKSSGGPQSGTPAAQQEPRRDADGFLIPALPIDPTLTGGTPEAETPKRGRPKKQPPAPIVVTEEELITEAELENDIEHVLNDDEMVDSRNELEKAKDEERAKTLAEQEKKSDAEKSQSRRSAEGINWWEAKTMDQIQEPTAEDLDAEFADDPEVLNCMLSPDEQQVKERIWIKENEDWLRLQHEKKLRLAVQEASGRNEKGKKKNRIVKRKKKGRMGDGTTMAEATTPIESPADASLLMLEKHAPPAFSKYINYEALRKVYEPSSSSFSGSRAGSQTPSVSEMGSGRTPSASPAPELRSATVRLQTPPATQGPGNHGKAASLAKGQQAPLSPPQTQTQASAGAEEAESEGDEDDYVQDEELDYGSDAGTTRGWGFGEQDDREDIGEDDYRRAINPESYLDGAADDDEY